MNFKENWKGIYE